MYTFMQSSHNVKMLILSFIIYSNVTFILTFIFRIVVQHLDEFKNNASEVTWHIPSKFTKEMSMKSEVVSNHKHFKKRTAI